MQILEYNISLPQCKPKYGYNEPSTEEVNHVEIQESFNWLIQHFEY